MPHWKALMDEKEWLYAFDLRGRDVDVQIDKVVGGEIVGDKGRKSKKPKAFFKGKNKPLLLNATNCKTIAAITGTNDVSQWAGQWITLFPTTCQSTTGDTVECIRVRPRAPKRDGAPAPEPTEAPEAVEETAAE